MVQVDEQKTVIAGDGHETREERVSFTPDQQARVQELIDSAYKRAYSKATGSAIRNEEVERLRDEVGRFKEYKKSAMILGAISRHNVVDVNEVAELIAPRMELEENGEISVRDGENNRKVGVEEYIDTWLSERPHHLRNSGHVGSGSQSAKFGAPGRRYDLSDPSVWRRMPREDLDQLLREGINVHGSKGQVFGFKDVKNPFREARKRKFNS